MASIGSAAAAAGGAAAPAVARTRETVGESSRDRILETAEVLFSRRGFTGVGLAEVAEAVGLRKSSLFHHFVSKTRLYVAVIEGVLTGIEERVNGALGGGEPPLARLERWLDALVDALAARPAAAPLLLRTLFEPDVTPAEEDPRLGRRLDAILDGVRNLLEEGIAAGSLRSVSVPHTIQTLIGMTVYHFASGDFGETLLRGPIHSPEEVRRRKREIRGFVRSGLRPAGV